jgi:CheY-like chemotaxis protein
MAFVRSHGPSLVLPIILLVEDEPLVRLFCADVLEEEGFVVIETGNAEEALLVLETRDDILVLFTDINMPGLNGLELAGRVHERWPHIQLVLTSGRERPSPDEMPDHGCFIAKPYHPDAVVDMIRTVAERVS